ncbi:MarR family winged helix-turn-helix transcriptional regulator [Microbacterium sp. 179-I 3D4 NHS]|uniref:MarR family winged helix-turn-helix transcriptional regulator n=1 Tax=Microbacterium sp. 179-I 3D4 NHS TaxID=3142381 RepID=UPI0039A2F410
MKTKTNETGVSTSELVRCVDDLRHAESQLSRRLAAVRAPNDTDRTALRFIARASEHAPVTPGDLAAHLGVSTAAVTSVVRRLLERGQIEVAAHPDDARSKVLRPSPQDGIAVIDELSRRIEGIADEFTPEQTAAVTRFLRRLTEEISDFP